MTKGAVGIANHLFSPRRHSSEGWNPGEEAGGGEEMAGLPDGALGNPFGCHSRVGGNGLLNHWIPACAGMTKGLSG